MATYLMTLLQMKKIKFESEILQYDKGIGLPSDEISLIEKSRQATQNSYSPYSGFKVGVALLLENNEIIIGTNQENAAYPSGLCAERTAIFYANSKYPEVAIVKMAISVFYKGKFIDYPVAPCGSCRQVMLETEVRYKVPIKTILDGEEIVYVIQNTKDILPLHFSESNL